MGLTPQQPHVLHMQRRRYHGTHQVTEGQKPEGGGGERWRTVRNHSEKTGMGKEELKVEGDEREEDKRRRNELKTISEKLVMSRNLAFWDTFRGVWGTRTHLYMHLPFRPFYTGVT